MKHQVVHNILVVQGGKQGLCQVQDPCGVNTLSGNKNTNTNININNR